MSGLSMRKSSLALMLMALCLCTHARAEVPVITTPVVDLAGVLSASDEERIAEQLVRLRAQTGVQMTVLTIGTLAGQPIEDFAQEVFTRWGGGTATRNDGVLFVLAVNDRRNRLQVGYGIEPILPDGRVVELLAELRPELRAGDNAGACSRIVASVAAAVAHLTPESAIAPPSPPLARNPRVLVAIGTFAWLAGIAFMLLRAKQSKAVLRSRKRKKSAPEGEAATSAVIPPMSIAARLRAIPRRIQSYVVWLGLPLLVSLVIGIDSGFGFALAVAVCWYAFAALGTVSGMVLELGRARAVFYLALSIAVIAAATSNFPVDLAKDPWSLALGSGFMAFMLAILSGMFFPGAAGRAGSSSSGGSYTSSRSSSSSSYSSSRSSSSSSYSSSSSSSSTSWSGGGGSSGGGGASSSW